MLETLTPDKTLYRFPHPRLNHPEAALFTSCLNRLLLNRGCKEWSERVSWKSYFRERCNQNKKGVYQRQEVLSCQAPSSSPGTELMRMSLDASAPPPPQSHRDYYNYKNVIQIAFYEGLGDFSEYSNTLMTFKIHTYQRYLKDKMFKGKFCFQE